MSATSGRLGGRQEGARRHIVWILLVLGFPVFLGNYFGGNAGINGLDANYYYAYAATWACGEQDLDKAYVKLVSRGLGESHFEAQRRTKSGRLYNFYPIGHPLLHLPATMLGRLVARAIEGSSDPYTTTCQLFYGLSCILAAACGLELLRRVIAESHDEAAAAFAVLALTSCSMLGFYWFIQPFHSHTSSLLLVGVLVAAFRKIEARRESGVGAYALVGVACGFAIMVRLNDMALISYAAVAAWLAVRNQLGIWDRLARVGGLGMGGLAGFGLQLLHWRWRDGAWIVREYSDYASFDWGNPQPMNLLFSWRHGLFSWHPILICAFAGFLLWFAGRARESHRRPMGGASIASWLGIAWIGSSFSIWWFGDSFGSRPFLSTLPVFALGLAELWTLSRRSAIGRGVLIMTTVLLSVWNAILAVTFQLGWISRSEALDVGALLDRLF